MVCLMMLNNLPWPRCSLPIDKHFLLLGRKFLLTYKFKNMIMLYNLEIKLRCYKGFGVSSKPHPQ